MPLKTPEPSAAVRSSGRTPESRLEALSTKEGLPITTLMPAAITPGQPPARQILVVDDNVSSAETLALLIGLSGHSTCVAHTGVDALLAVEAQRPDVVLLDIGLPGMDGYEVARRLRRAEINRDLLLVAVTGYGQEDDRRRSSDAGFNHHLVKPLDLEQLEAILNQAGPAACA